MLPFKLSFLWSIISINVILGGYQDCSYHFSDKNVSFDPYITDEYALYGEWARYNRQLDLLLAFEILIDSTCENVKFTLVSPGCSNMWFGIGIGSSSEMNGYAIITFVGEIPDGYQQTYESTLEAGVFPQAQTSQDLRNCTVSIENCIQTVICYRDYATGDSEDFYQFMQGINPIFWAFGNLQNDSLPIQHTDSSVAFIELKGAAVTAQCVYGKEEGNDRNNIDEWVWMDIAILLTVLVILAGFFFCCVYCYKLRSKNSMPGNHMDGHTRVQSTDSGFSPTKNGTKGHETADLL